MQQDFELLLALDEKEQAYGEWYLDDGDGAGLCINYISTLPYTAAGATYSELTQTVWG